MKNRLIYTMLFLFLLYACTNRKNDETMQKDGKILIEKVEEFKKKNNRLPDRISEIGYVENLEGPIYYEKKDSLNYIVWYGTSLGESMTYYSSERKWR